MTWTKEKTKAKNSNNGHEININEIMNKAQQAEAELTETETNEPDKFKQLFDKAFIKNYKELPDPITLIYAPLEPEISIYFRKTYNIVTGQAGSRKTAYTLSLIALAKNAKILWIDTEQSDFDIKWLIWKAKEKYNIESIDFFAFRELDFNEANTTPFELIEYIISIQNGYDIIVIDNITDLDDACVMDNVASTKIVRKLMKLSSDKNLALIGIVHENEKKLENVGGRGHVGSESVRKAHNVTTLTKDGENTNVTFRKTRKKAPADFEFQVDNENMPIYDVNLYVNKTDKLTSIIKADNFIDRLIANGFSKEKSYAIAQKYAIEKLQNIFNGYGLIKIKDLVIPKICELGIFETFDKGNRKMFFITKNEIPF